MSGSFRSDWVTAHRGQLGNCLIIDPLGTPDAGILTIDVAAELRVRDGAAHADADILRVSERK